MRRTEQNQTANGSIMVNGVYVGTTAEETTVPARANRTFLAAAAIGGYADRARFNSITVSTMRKYPAAIHPL